MLKIMLSYSDTIEQKQFALYIKFMELKYTISFFEKNPLSGMHTPNRDSPINTGMLFDEIMPFCDDNGRRQMAQFKSMMNNFENMQQMMSTVQMMKELFPDGMGDISNGSMDISQILSMFGDNNAADLFSMFHTATDE